MSELDMLARELRESITRLDGLSVAKLKLARAEKKLVEQAATIATMERLVGRGRKDEAAIPADVLKRLIQLCHPDRHGGSDAAHKATQWLLARRKGSK